MDRREDGKIQAYYEIPGTFNTTVCVEYDCGKMGFRRYEKCDGQLCEDAFDFLNFGIFADAEYGHDNAGIVVNDGPRPYVYAMYFNGSREATNA